LDGLALSRARNRGASGRLPDAIRRDPVDVR